jgi:putative nucleotidyltransferase with HDIG domain
VGPRISDAAIAEQVQAAVLQRLEADDLVLPAMPLAVSKCLALLQDPNLSLAGVARVIETDPIVAAQIVRLANVAARAPVAPVRSITECVTRLGAMDLQLFLIETAARRVFESTDRHIAEICRGLWAHSLAVAMLARDLLKQSAGERPSLTDEAYLAGLLHDIGKPVLAAMLLDAEKRLRGTRTKGWMPPATWLRLISESHRRIGVALAEKWNMPEGVRLSIRDAGVYDTAEPHSTANAVRLANALSKLEGVYVGVMDEAETESLVAAGRALFGLDDARLDFLTTYLKERVNERLA